MFFVIRNSQTAHVGDRAHTAVRYAVHTGHLLYLFPSIMIQHRIPPPKPMNRRISAHQCLPRLSNTGASHAAAAIHSAITTKPMMLKFSWYCQYPKPGLMLKSSKTQSSPIPKDGAAPWYHLASQRLPAKKQANPVPHMHDNGCKPHQATDRVHPCVQMMLCEATFPHPTRRRSSSR